MTISNEDLEIYLNNLAMQAERENAEFAQQIFIRGQIRKATAQLAQSNVYALDILIENARAIANQNYFAQGDQQTERIAQQYAPTKAERTVNSIYGQINGGMVQ